MSESLQLPVSDFRLAYLLKKHIKKNKHATTVFKNFLNCGHVHNTNAKSQNIIITSNGKTSHILNVRYCGTSWVCPICSSKKMSKAAARIAIALDMLKKYNQRALMITFTIPHLPFMTCVEVTDILLKSWKKFNYKNKKKKFDISSISIQKFKQTYTDARSVFQKTLGVTHSVRALEYTWSEKNHWHPHFHILIWMPKKNLQLALAFEHDLREQWYKIVNKTTKEVLSQRTDPEWRNFALEKFEENLQNIPLKYLHEQRLGVHISTDENGKVIAQESSMYICGWGADREVTGNKHKIASHNGHYTLNQLLQEAYECDRQGLETQRDKWLDIYMELAYAQNLHPHTRYKFSHTGICTMIENWKKTKEYKETLLKKNTEIPPQKMVCYLSSKQWSLLLSAMTHNNVDLISAILDLALLSDGREQIEFLLLMYDIDIRNNPPLPESEMLFENYSAA